MLDFCREPLSTIIVVTKNIDTEWLFLFLLFYRVRCYFPTNRFFYQLLHSIFIASNFHNHTTLFLIDTSFNILETM